VGQILSAQTDSMAVSGRDEQSIGKDDGYLDALLVYIGAGDGRQHP
jgi:hypothetical protein